MSLDEPIHLHRELKLDKGDVVEVFISNPAKVYLMTAENYRRFLQWEPFEAYGGQTDLSPARLAAPGAGIWHLAVLQVHEAMSLDIRVVVHSKHENKTQRGRTTAPPGRPAVGWDFSAADHCVLTIDKVRKFLTRAEANAFIHQIVRGKNDLARRKLAYSWLKKERSDILVEGQIEDALSPVLWEMIRQIQEVLKKAGHRF